MKHFLSILILFSLSAQGQFRYTVKATSGISRFATTGLNFNALKAQSTFVPATTLTAGVNQYQSYKYGWLICYGINTYNGHFWDQAAQAPPPATDFNIPNVNVQAWADSAQAHGVQYAALTVLNEYGFSLYPTEVAYKMTQVSLSNGLSPYYTTPYCVKAGVADTAIVSKFVSTFAAKGIEPVLYMAFGWDQNLRQVSGGQLWSGVDADRQEAFVQHKCKQIQELAWRWPRVKYFWIDLAAPIPQAHVQRLYNALKSANPNAVFIGNAAGESDFGRFPYDVGSVEEYIAYNNISTITSNSMAFGGTTYYVGKEVVGTPYSTYSQWYDYDNLCPDQPVNNPLGSPSGYVKLASVSTSTFQGLVNNARTYNRPFFAAMLVTRAGTLLQNNLDFLRQINFQ